MSSADHLFKSYLFICRFCREPEVQLEKLKSLEHLQCQSRLLIEEAKVKEKENYAKWNLKHKPRSDPLQVGDLIILQAAGTIREFRLHGTVYLPLMAGQGKQTCSRP